MTKGKFPNGLSKIMDARALGPSELAGLVDTSKQNIQRWRDGERKIPAGWVSKLAQLFSLPREQIVFEDWRAPASTESDSPTLGPAIAVDVRTAPMDLPILGGAECGKDGLFEFNGERLGFVRRPPKLMGVSGAYALYARGDSMSPWRENGQLVFVHPTIPVNVGDYVVVELHPENEGASGRAYIKRLERRTANEIKLFQFNPRKELSLPRKRVLNVHKILSLEEMMSF